VDFVAVMDQTIALLRQRGRVTYRTLQLQFTLTDEQLAALKDELLYSQPQVVDDGGRGLVIPIEMGTLLQSIANFLFFPIAVGWLGRWVVRRWCGTEFFSGPFKRWVGEVKLWALVVIIIAIFASQTALSIAPGSGTDRADPLRDQCLLRLSVCPGLGPRQGLPLGLRRHDNAHFHDDRPQLRSGHRRGGQSLPWPAPGLFCDAARTHCGITHLAPLRLGHVDAPRAVAVGLTAPYRG
jgi:Sodium Bile acid symporter family